MSDKTDHEAAERHSATLQLAYHLWEQAGRPHGEDQHFWDLAQAKMTEAHWTPPPPAPDED